MRPIRLSLQAFGPFAAKEVVDFRFALESGLFGVYGQTGAGKSTLFSAISFALFGEPTKAEQEPRSLRSDHAAADLPTEVELVFELGAKTYLIRRRPAQERPKARGEGMTADAAEASLFDVTGIALDALGSGQSGRVIAERKVSVVGQEIEKLLGYGADHFRQIVLLPQGKFETFLAAKTDARVEILRELFDVKVYRDLAARLKEEAAQAERNLREQRALYIVRLQERGFESIEALELAMEGAAAQVGERQQAQGIADAAAEAARQALTKGEQVEKAFAAVDAARQALDSLETKTVEIDALAKRVETTGNALQARDIETAWQEAERDLRDAAKAVTGTETDLGTAIQARQDSERDLAEAKAGDGKRQAVQADLTRLEEIEQRVGQAALLKALFEDAAKEEGRAKRALAETERAHETLQSRRDATDTGLEQARKTEASRGKLTSDLAEVDRELSKSGALTRAEQAVSEAEENVEAASDALAAKTKTAEAAELALTEAEARLTRTQAIILAEKLTEGAPCPVCGSPDHPAPAEGTPEQSGLTEVFRQAQADARAESEAHIRAESALGHCLTRLDERKRALSEQDRPARSVASLETDKLRLEGELAAIGDTVDIDAMAERLDRLKQDLRDAEAAAATARTRAGRAETASATARAKHEAVVGSLPEELRSPEAVAARRDLLLSTRKQLSEALDRAEQGDRKASEVLTRTQEQLEAARRASETQLRRAEKARNDFTARLEEVGLDEATYAACKVHFPTLVEDRETVRAHREKLIAAQTTWQDAAVACAERERPDLAPLEQTQESTAHAVKAANIALAEAQTDVDALMHFKRSLAEALARTEELEAKTGPLRGLADLANGKNELSMTLETFAIAAMFDQVLEAANLRLDLMMRGRYRLERGVEASGGRGKRGLEIEVFDVNTGKARPTATLSGGETFISALALALGLADVVESLSGKIRMDTIFIDEGFGSLDTENGAGTLDQVLQVLAALTKGSRAVGLISHVGLVQEAIPQGFYVRSTPGGSKVEERRGLS
ncbi:AAA family ATPase [Szabonella alba]|uniref:SMC family ATPase n=1 Tax=Szabonella alba TaxID=2804194 RepID=A0A8K0Y2Q1_9RHOB|nr:SMC family ATPase [Szabonella alba]MBL4918664.1 SMC family ATPase [Szabonella alba]